MRIILVSLLGLFLITKIIYAVDEGEATYIELLAEMFVERGVSNENR